MDINCPEFKLISSEKNWSGAFAPLSSKKLYCFFVNTHSYSNSLSAIAIISSWIILESFPAVSLAVIILIYRKVQYDQMITILYLKEFFFSEPAMMAGDWSNLMRDLSVELIVPTAFSSKVHFLCKFKH